MGLFNNEDIELLKSEEEARIVAEAIKSLNNKDIVKVLELLEVHLRNLSKKDNQDIISALKSLKGNDAELAAKIISSIPKSDRVDYTPIFKELNESIKNVKTELQKKKKFKFRINRQLGGRLIDEVIITEE